MATGYEGGNAPPPSYSTVGPSAPAAQVGGAPVQAVDQYGNPIQVVMMPAQGAMVAPGGGPVVAPGGGAVVVQQQHQVVAAQPGYPGQQQQYVPAQQGYPGTASTTMGTTAAMGAGTLQPATNVPQTNVVTTTTVVHARYPVDDPQCIYILACVGFFIPLIGFIGMCVYNCGSGLPPRMASAYKWLVGCTIAGCIINIIISVSSG